MKEIDTTKPVETVGGLKVIIQEGKAFGAYPIWGDIHQDDGSVYTGALWSVKGLRHPGGRESARDDLRNVTNFNEIDWAKPGILDELQYAGYSAPHKLTAVLTTTKPGSYPVVLCDASGMIVQHFTKEGRSGSTRCADLVRKPRKVTRTLYFAKAHIDAIEKGKSQYLNNSPGDVAVKVEYTV